MQTWQKYFTVAKRKIADYLVKNDSASVFWGLDWAFTTNSGLLSFASPVELNITFTLRKSEWSLIYTLWLRCGEWIHRLTKPRTGNTTSLTPAPLTVTDRKGLWSSSSYSTSFPVERRGGWGRPVVLIITLTFAARMESSTRISETFRLKKIPLLLGVAIKKLTKRIA